MSIIFNGEIVPSTSSSLLTQIVICLFMGQQRINPIDFIRRVRCSASIHFEIPAKNFLFCRKIIDVNTNGIVNRSQRVFVILIQSSESRNFTVKETKDSGNSLKAIYTDVIGIIRYLVLMMDLGVVEIEITTRLAATQEEFDIRNLLRFGPDMTTLEIRVEL